MKVIVVLLLLICTSFALDKKDVELQNERKIFFMTKPYLPSIVEAQRQQRNVESMQMSTSRIVLL
jgi:hypothetical protein